VSPARNKGYFISLILKNGVQAGLPDFPWYYKPKLGQWAKTAAIYIGNGHAYHIPNNYKIYQIAVKYTYGKIFHSKAFYNMPKLGFLVCK
jgi:hypothetical protein